MTPLDCKVNLPADGPLKVGQPFTLRCLGERPVFSEIEMKFQLPDESQYALKILGSEFISDDEMILNVTSYQAGEHSLAEFFLVSGTDYVPVNPVAFTVESSLNPSSPEQEPYPPKGPISLGVPLWYYLAFAIPIAVIGVAVCVKAFFYIRKKQEVETIKVSRPAMGYYQYFNKELRLLQREYPLGTPEALSPARAQAFLEGLDRSFRKFLEWHFLVRERGRSDTTLLRQVRKEMTFKEEEVLYDGLRKVIVELVRASKAKVLTGVDARQLLEECRNVATKVHRQSLRDGGAR